MFFSKDSIFYKSKEELDLDTTVLQIGTKLYLTDKITPAIPGNLSSRTIAK